MPKEPIEVGTTNASPEVKEDEVKSDIWSKAINDNYRWYLQRDSEASAVGFLIIHANGGLNQMKMRICDINAKLMWAELVLPYLDHTSHWSDPNNSTNNFDRRSFVTGLRDNVGFRDEGEILLEIGGLQNDDKKNNSEMLGSFFAPLACDETTVKLGDSNHFSMLRHDIRSGMSRDCEKSFEAFVVIR